jgi:UDP-N-acetylglucosamine transferase subunit ALG13
MIFCTVGNDHHKFDRFINLVGKVYQHFSGNTEMFLQYGYSRKSSILKTQDAFLSRKSFDWYIRMSDVVICHAGAGTIAQCLQQGKIPIVIPRIYEKNEHLNNHQLDIANHFNTERMCYVVNSFEGIIEAMSASDGRKHKKYKSTKENLEASLRQDFDYILNLKKIKNITEV